LKQRLRTECAELDHVSSYCGSHSSVASLIVVDLQNLAVVVDGLTAYYKCDFSKKNAQKLLLCKLTLEIDILITVL